MKRSAKKIPRLQSESVNGLFRIYSVINQHLSFILLSYETIFSDYYCLFILVDVRLRATVSDIDGPKKGDKFSHKIIQDVVKQSTLHPKSILLKESAVYMIYKIANKDTNPRRMWKRSGSTRF